ncbi:hypothetical protein AB0I10_05545 [Streptomyces sp. NPDC050636]|uniref:hypothetical protein n=1 Tax=Streptomyces sp. NPDC050636 TaxID=3154510 RepID=UPI00343CE143
MKRLRVRTARMSVVAGVAAAGLAFGLAGAGAAHAAPEPGFKGGKVYWKANGDTVTITDTKRDGYAFNVAVYISDASHSPFRQCKTSGVGQTKTCRFNYPEGRVLIIEGALDSATDIKYSGETWVRA